MIPIISKSLLNTTLYKPHFSDSGDIGLPNCLREALLQRDMGAAALVLDACLLVGLRPGQTFTFVRLISRLAKAGVAVSHGLIRRGLNSCFIRGKIIIGRGRPRGIYRMPALDDLLITYGAGKWMATDVLGPGDLSSLKAYRMGLHREFLRRRPGAYSRQWLGGRLGVGRRTTVNYDRELGVRVEQRFSEQQIDWYSNWPDLVACAIPGMQWLRLKFWETGVVLSAPLRVGIGYAYRGKAAIYLVTQLTNHYWFEEAGDVDSWMPSAGLDEAVSY